MNPIGPVPCKRGIFWRSALDSAGPDTEGTMTLSESDKLVRKRRITSTRIAGLAGLSPWKRPIDVYREIQEADFQIADTLAMRLGRRLEGPLADEYAAQTGYLLTPIATVLHPKYPEIIAATPDRIAVIPPAGPEHVVEIKTTSREDGWGEPGTDQIPAYYICQVAWEMACTDLFRADVVVLIGGNDFRIYHLIRDMELEAQLIEIALKFWRDHIEPKIPPTADGTESYSDYLKARFPREKVDTYVKADSTIEDMCQQLRDARGRLRVIEDEADRITQVLKGFIGDNAGLEGEFGRIHWKANKDGTTTDWKALALDICHASVEQVKQATEPKPGARVFRPSWRKS